MVVSAAGLAALAIMCCAFNAHGERIRALQVALESDGREMSAASASPVARWSKAGLLAAALARGGDAFAPLHDTALPQPGNARVEPPPSVQTTSGSWIPPHAVPDQWVEHIDGLVSVRRGKFGTIYRVIVKNDPAVELIVKAIRPRSEAELGCARREIALMAELQHFPGMIAFHAATPVADLKPRDTVYMLMEAAAGNLEDIVLSKTMDEIGLGTRLRLFADVLRAVVHISDKGIVHRDLKPGNILLVGGSSSEPWKGTAVLGDWGCASSTPGGPWYTDQYCGTAQYVPPESWRPETASCKYDVFSLGIILYRLLTCSWPEPLCDKLGGKESRRLIVLREFRISKALGFANLKVRMPEMARLLIDMVDVDQVARISANEALARLEAFAQSNSIDIEPRRRVLAPAGVSEWSVLVPPPQPVPGLAHFWSKWR